VNVFPSAVRDVICKTGSEVSGTISIQPKSKTVKQAPPLLVIVELARGVAPDKGLADRIRQRLRDELLVTTEVALVQFGTLPRTDYKSKLVDWSQSG
jgi:phenylacetate-CoA ligase